MRKTPIPAARVVRLLFVGLLGACVGSRGASAADPAPGYLGPRSLAVSPDGRTLYVACEDARQVAWVGTADGKVIRRVDLPAEPTGLALSPDASRLAVTCAAPKSGVVVLDADTGQSLQVLPAGHTAMSPVFSSDGKRLYVCNRFDNDVSVFDLTTGDLVARIRADREPIVAAMTPDGRTLLVADHLPNTRTDRAFEGNVSPRVTFVDTQSLQTSTTALPHGANGIRGMSVSPDGQYALVTHLLSNFESVPFRVDTGWINVNVVSVIDLPQRTVIATIGLDEYYRGAGNPWDVLWSADGTMVYISVAGTHELAVIRAEDLLSDQARRTMQPMMVAWPIYPSLGASLWRRIALPGKGMRGLAAVGSKVYVAQYFSDSIAQVDLHPGGEARMNEIALGAAPVLTEVRRGHLLFEDATLCYQHWQSCASCHPDARVDGLNWDLLNDGPGNPKNTKSMLLSHATPPSMALGVRATAEIAVRAGFVHILFSEPPDEDSVAIDAYLKSLRPVPSPYLVDGGLSELAERGRELYDSDRIGCYRCHPAPLYTDLRAHNVGTRTPNDRLDRFDTPTLVEAWRTAPYLHDGRYTTIRQLLTEGRHGLRPNEKLNEDEIDALVEFVLSL
ncbi:MAG: beta-propeller fold lactonase family protein [Pirellulaceae bacterium]|nr:beta-propeller fold lactonase family protein [Pirellulaceae bacterium]